MVGEILGAYRIVARLGEGGMGAVFVGAHTRIERLVAIKVLRPELSLDERMVSRFFTEARATSRIRHPGIVEVFDCDITAAGQAYIVMELLEGETLASAIKGAGKLGDDLGAVVSIGAQIASALAAAHDKGIVHRDIKPDNVFLTLDGAHPQQAMVKIVDFGIAKLLDRNGEGSATRTGNIIGTPQFMAPEQCRGIAMIDQRVDVYALGCILMATATGEPPFTREAIGDLMMAHMSEAPPLLADRLPGAPPALTALVARCLEKEPERRPGDMRLIENELREIGRHVPPAHMLLRNVLSHWRSQMSVDTRPLPPAPVGPGAPAMFSAPAAVPEPLRVATPGGTRLLPVSTPLRAPFGTTLGERAGEIEPSRRASVPRWAKMASLVLIATVPAAVFLARRGQPSSPPSALAKAGGAAPPLGAESAPVSRGIGGGSRAIQGEGAKPSPRSVSIQLRGLPVGAVLNVDGEPADAPIELPRDERSHRVVIRAPGYLDEKLTVEGTKDQRLAVVMRAAPVAVTPVREAPPALTRKRSRSHARASTKPDSQAADFRGFDDL